MQNEQSFLDAVTIADFLLGMLNYRENLTQNDKSEILQNSQNVSDVVINKIDRHLQLQDKKIDYLIQLLEQKS